LRTFLPEKGIAAKSQIWLNRAFPKIRHKVSDFWSDEPNKQVKDEHDACYEEAHWVRLIKSDKEPQPRCYQSNGYRNNYDLPRSFCQ
jgi:hypothetical protein